MLNASRFDANVADETKFCFLLLHMYAPFLLRGAERVVTANSEKVSE